MDDRLEIPDERSRLPYFAGRDAELNAFERKLRGVCADGQSTSGVVLTTGVQPMITTSYRASMRR